LHVPHHLCGPLLERELALWGIQPAIEIQNCCVSHLMDTKSRLISLKQFENFFKEEMETEPVVPLDCIENDDFGGPTSNSSKESQSFLGLAASALLEDSRPSVVGLPGDRVRGASDHHGSVRGVQLRRKHVGAVPAAADQREIQFYSNKHPSWYGNHTDAQTRIKADWLVFSDWFAFGVLTFDFLVRLLCCKNKLAYFKNAYTVIDLLSILPFYVNELLKLTWGIIEFSEPNSFGVTEYIAFLKISLFVRLLRIGRHYRGLQVLIYTLKTSLRDLMLMGVFVALGTLLFSTLIFFCEKSRSGGETHLAPTAPPDKKKVDCSKCQKGDTDSKFNSMFDGFWWSLVTMTTVGYGDLVPQTSSGRALRPSVFIRN
uniref:Ion_trans domain-containing protein n=1 Tax=Macrostomum lignano TaxID=282301 RepID=A0A1I8H710_9PLAT